jgi:uncharacterized protein (DUF2267 family)
MRQEKLDPKMGDIEEFDDAASAAQHWLSGAMEQLGWHDRRKAYRACMAILHALRDYLPLDETIYLGAQLPPVLRGFYYDGWHPFGRPLALSDRAEFIERVESAIGHDPAVDVEKAARGVLAYLSAKLPAGELEELKAASPRVLRPLWPS